MMNKFIEKIESKYSSIGKLDHEISQIHYKI